MSEDYLPPLPPPIDAPYALDEYEIARPGPDPRDVTRFRNWLQAVREAAEKPITLPLPRYGSRVSHEYGRETP